jgi:hypothetical protein
MFPTTKHSYSKNVFNFELGEMHTDHTQLANYMKEVAKVSDKLRLKPRVRSKIALTTVNDFKSKNLARIKEINEQHLANLTDGNNQTKIADMPMWFIWV